MRFSGNAVQIVNILAHRLGDGDNAVGVLVCGLFQPGTGAVGGAELLGLPGSMRLQRMSSQHQGGAGQLPNQTTGEVRVPSVTMNHVGLFNRRRHRQVADKRVHEFRAPRIATRDVAIGLNAADRQVAFLNRLVAEGEDLNRVAGAVETSQFAREIFDVDAGAAVDVGRVLVRQDDDVHTTPLPFRGGVINPFLEKYRKGMAMARPSDRAITEIHGYGMAS